MTPSVIPCAVGDPLVAMWDRLTRLKGWDDVSGTYRALMERYDEKHRHFHTRAHLADVFGALAIDRFSAADQAALIAATFWHDAVYDTSSPEAVRRNEENSAVLAARDLYALGAADAFVARVTAMIHATRTHECDAAADPVTAHFLDCDMATLAGTWDDYEPRMHTVYQEYAALPPTVFFTGRLEKFLVPLLAKPAVFLLAANEARWGASARANMTQEKDLIEQGLTMVALKHTRPLP